MPISFACPTCGIKIKAPDAAAGRQVSCPGCKGAVKVPRAPDPIPSAPVVRPQSLAFEIEPPRPTEAPRRREEVDIDDDEPRRKSRRDDEKEDRPRKSRREDDEDDRPRRRSRDEDGEEVTKGSGAALGLGITSMVVGILALPFAVIPCCGMVFAIPFGIIGLVFGGAGLAVAYSQGKRSMGFPIAGLSISSLALLITIGWWVVLAGTSVATVAAGGNGTQGMPTIANKDAGAKSPVSMTAEEITKEFVGLDGSSKEGREALEKYKNRVFEVTGVVQSSAKLLGNTQTWSLNLEGVDKADAKRGFQVADCQFAPDSPAYQKAKIVKKGQTVKIRGEFRATFEYGVRITKCDLIEDK